MKYESTAPLISTRSICLTAVMTALVFIMTAVPRIPIPLGYAHLGDAMIFLVVLYGGYKEGALAASVGSALADLIGGFPIWIVPTLIIKYVMAVIIWKMLQDKTAHYHIFSKVVLAALVWSDLWMVLGYTLSGAILYGGLTVGLTATPGLAVKGLLNLFVAIGGALILERSGGFSIGKFNRNL